MLWGVSVYRSLLWHDRVMEIASSFGTLARFAAIHGAISVLIVTVLLLAGREGYRELGFRGKGIVKSLAIGAGFGAAIFLVDNLLLEPLGNALIPAGADPGIDLAPMFQDLRYLPAWLLLVTLKGGFAEEAWRLFTLTRFERAFGRAGLIFALVVDSAVFGIAHLYQGVDSAVTLGVVGLLYALVYLRRRSAWEAVAAHAAFDLIAVTFGFILYLDAAPVSPG